MTLTLQAGNGHRLDAKPLEHLSASENELDDATAEYDDAEPLEYLSASENELDDATAEYDDFQEDQDDTRAVYQEFQGRKQKSPSAFTRCPSREDASFRSSAAHVTVRKGSSRRSHSSSRSKKTSHKPRVLQEVDNIRPDSDKHRFSPTHARKQELRAAREQDSTMTNSRKTRRSPTDAEQLQTLTEENEVLKSTVEDLKARLLEVQAELDKKTSRSQAKLLKINKETERRVTKVAKDFLFSNTKFIASEARLEHLTGVVLDQLPEAKDFDKEKRDSWIITYKTAVKDGINDKRNYVQSQMKIATTKWMIKQDADLPALNLIYACALRKVKLDNPEHAKLMKWYTDSILSCIVGSQGGWNAKTKYYKCISDATIPGMPDKPLFTPSHEAFVVLVYENCRDKWIARRKWYAENPSETRLPGRKDEWKEHEIYVTKYTNQDKGQATFSGWAPEGLQQFMKYRKAIKKRWNDAPDECRAVEESVLQLLKDEKGKLGATAQEDRNLSGKKRKQEQQAEVVVIVTADSDEE